MIEFSRPTILKKDLLNVLNCMVSDKIEEGELTKNFEKKFAEIIGQKDSILVNNGTAALYLIFYCLGIKVGSEIILPAYTEKNILEVIFNFGAKPILCDLQENSYHISADQIKEKITEKTSAIIISHLFGYPYNYENLNFIPENIPVIEDCTQSLGSLVNNHQVGYFGDFAFFSFSSDKIITMGEGGAIIAKKKNQLNEIRDLRSYRNSDDIKGRLNFSNTDIQAAMGLAEISMLNKFYNRRKEIAEFYINSLLRGRNKFLNPGDDHHPNFCIFPVIFASSLPDVKKMFKKYSIEVKRPISKPLYSYLDISEEKFPNARQIYLKTLGIPIYPSMKKDDIETIGKLLQRIQ